MEGFPDTLRLLHQDTPYAEAMRRNLPHFPAIDCPGDLKEALSALARDYDIDEYLDLELGALGKRTTLRQLLLAREFRRVREFVVQFMIVEISGPGAL